MKRLFLLLLTLSALNIFAEAKVNEHNPSLPKSKETLIHETIEASKDVNSKLYGIIDPNKIWVGDVLVFHFADGTDMPWTVQKGQNEWIILDSVYTNGLNHGGVVPSSQNAGITQDKASNSDVISVAGFIALLKTVPDWAWVLMLLLVTASVVAKAGRDVAAWYKRTQAIETERERIQNDPVLAGPPVVPNGITDQNAEEAMTYAAKKVFDTDQPIKVISMKKGTLNGTGVTVFFNGNQTKSSMAITNRRGVKAEVFVGDEPEARVVYSLEECGNPVRRGEFIVNGPGSEITFTPDTVGSNIPVAVEAPVEVLPEEPVNQILSGIPAMVNMLKNHSEGTVTLRNGDFVLTLEVKNPVAPLLALAQNNGHEVHAAGADKKN